MANEQNLKPIRTTQRARELQEKAAQKQRENIQRKKTIKEQFELLLSLPLKDAKAKAKLNQLGIDAENIDNQMAMVISMWNKALKGDVQAFNSIQASIGEKPKEEIELTGKSKKFAEICEQLGDDGLNE